MPGYLTLERHVTGGPSTECLVRIEQATKQLNFCAHWKNNFTVTPFPVKKVAV